MANTFHKWLITGANGNLGRRLIDALMRHTNDQVVTLVRSQSAQAQLAATVDQYPKRFAVSKVEFNDTEAIKQAAAGCQIAVHLVGILKATKTASYAAAHEESCAALLTAIAATKIEHVTYLSILGSRPDAVNACLASKGRAEQMLLDSDVNSCVIRVPMVLGEGDYASFALRKRAAAKLAVVLRGSSLEQPIYAGDVVAAIRQAAMLRLDGAGDLAGPESLSRNALTQRAAAVLGSTPRLLSIPVQIGYLAAGLLTTLLANPPVTTAMLGVLDHDDKVDPTAALERLGLDGLTDLDTMLRKIL